MTYAPNIFSTQAGLSRTVVFQWIEGRDLDTIKRWLTQGAPHPRLATEGIGHAVHHGHVDIAQMIWEKNWHRPKQVFEAAAQQLLYAHANLKRGGKHNYTGVTQQAYAAAVHWLFEKTNVPTAKGPEAKAANLGRIAGLKLAFDTDNEQLWDKIIRSGPDLSTAEGSELFRHLSLHLSFWPNEFSHARNPAPEWAERRVLDDLFSNGLRPGGSVWVGAASHECARPLLDKLRSQASRLTNPRMRTAILISAAENKCPGLDELMDIFVPLSVPLQIKLTPSEIKKVSGYSTAGVYLEDRAQDHSFGKFVWNTHRESEFSADNATEHACLKSALGQEGAVLFQRAQLMVKADEVAPETRSALRPRGM